ncbi:MAG: 50S ribosomal protein L30e [Candidatus Aenigmarchaeota archaeon]|nr:50S ribosomal protein L30e [Candidatus Aenigmarchaeota archaeon]
MKELKDALKENKVVMGTDRTMKSVKLGKAETVVLASNCPDDVRKDLEKYTKLSGIKLENFEGTAKQLGVFCGKPFSIASLAIVK